MWADHTPAMSPAAPAPRTSRQEAAAPAATAAVSLRGLRKTFGSVTAVDGIDLDIADGEFFAMLGPSGSGKTTVLRMIAGFEPPTEADASDTCDSDPRRPVPFIEDVEIGMSREYMVADQRFASRRPDVLAYRTEPLEEDLTLAGPLVASLFVATTGTDSD